MDRYEFDRRIERRGTACVKWDEMKRHFGREDLLPMWVADMDFMTSPEILEAMETRMKHGIFGYVTTGEGFNALAADWTRRRYGHGLEPATLVHSPGVVPSLSLLIRLFTVPEEPVIIQPPVYPPFRNVLLQNGRKPLENPLLETGQGYRMDFEGLEALAARPEVRWMILCNPHNPVGRAWDREELTRLAEICKANGVRVISDEIWRDHVFEPHHHIPLASLDAETEQLTITCFSATKSFNLAGLQSSFVSLPLPQEREVFAREWEILDITRHNVFSQTAVEAAFTSGEPWLEEAKAYIQENIRMATDFLETHLPEVRMVPPEATYLLWLDFRALKLRGKALAGLLEHEGRIALNAGASFGAEGKGFMRMNVACPREQVREALIRIETAVNHWRHDL